MRAAARWPADAVAKGVTGLDGTDSVLSSAHQAALAFAKGATGLDGTDSVLSSAHHHNHVFVHHISRHHICELSPSVQHYNFCWGELSGPPDYASRGELTGPPVNTPRGEPTGPPVNSTRGELTGPPVK